MYFYAIIFALTLLLTIMTWSFSNWETRKIQIVLDKMNATNESIEKILVYHATNDILVNALPLTVDSELKRLYILYKNNACELICSIESIIPKENYHAHCTQAINCCDMHVNIHVLKNNKQYLEKVIAIYNTIISRYQGIEQKRMNIELFMQWYHYYVPLLNQDDIDDNVYYLENAFRN